MLEILSQFLINSDVNTIYRRLLGPALSICKGSHHFLQYTAEFVLITIPTRYILYLHRTLVVFGGSCPNTTCTFRSGWYLPPAPESFLGIGSSPRNYGDHASGLGNFLHVPFTRRFLCLFTTFRSSAREIDQRKRYRVYILKRNV